ncbi:MAG: helix-turn-helix domain-containing protein [Eubacterium sp.]
MFENYDDILTVEEVAEALKVGTTQVYKLVRSGEMNAFKEGKNWRIPKKGVINYVSKRGRI